MTERMFRMGEEYLPPNASDIDRIDAAIDNNAAQYSAACAITEQYDDEGLLILDSIEPQSLAFARFLRSCMKKAEYQGVAEAELQVAVAEIAKKGLRRASKAITEIPDVSDHPIFSKHPRSRAKLRQEIEYIRHKSSAGASGK
jgi:hypothetical protein